MSKCIIAAAGIRKNYSGNTVLPLYLNMNAALIRNHIASIIASLVLVIFGESITALIGTISRVSDENTPIGSLIIRHSLYGLSFTGNRG